MQRRPMLSAALRLLAAAWATAPLLAAAQPGSAPPPEVVAALPAARWQGTAVMRFLGLQIYTLRLWAAAPLAGDGTSQPLALELQYSRALSGTRIAQRSIDEMKRIAPFSDAQSARWLSAMTGLFPDVHAGDRLTGLQLPGQGARFFFNGVLRGEVADAEFARLFFGIWLSPQTSEPALRAELLGTGP
jgi:hypothetical protein